jgi:flagellar assembly protein FliH
VIKQRFTIVDPEVKRVIDSNTLVEERLEELAEKMKEPAEEGFVPGLEAEEIPSEELLTDENGEVKSDGIVARAGDEADRLLEQAKEEAAGIEAKAKAEAMEMLERAKTEAEVEKNRILSDAKQQGYDEGFEQAEAENERMKQQYLEKEKELEKNYQDRLDNMEPQLVDLITDIYEQIFHVELKSERDILVHLITTAMRKLDGSGQTFIIHVSKEDYPYISMQKKQLLSGGAAANTNLDVVEDMTLSRNDCMIETDSGIFDCGLGTQLSELKQKLMLLAWSKEE